MPIIRIAESDAEIERCLPVMQQLRPHLTEANFVSRIKSQQAGGYRLAFAESEAAVRAAAGFRVLENLASGRLLYVDDLVTDAPERGRGFGKAMLEWLVALARREGCRNVELDSGVQRFAAHRFYLTNGMVISSHHFRLVL